MAVNRLSPALRRIRDEVALPILVLLLAACVAAALIEGRSLVPFLYAEF